MSLCFRTPQGRSRIFARVYMCLLFVAHCSSHRCGNKRVYFVSGNTLEKLSKMSLAERVSRWLLMLRRTVVAVGCGLEVNRSF